MSRSGAAGEDGLPESACRQPCRSSDRRRHSRIIMVRCRTHKPTPVPENRLTVTADPQYRSHDVLRIRLPFHARQHELAKCTPAAFCGGLDGRRNVMRFGWTCSSCIRLIASEYYLSGLCRTTPEHSPDTCITRRDRESKSAQLISV